jgi:rhamnosyltransferase
MADIPELGIKTAFLSNSFAAYRRSTFWDMGGFPDDVIFGEDMILAAKLILAGYGIAYNASACVFHSHDYSPCEQFGRYFDIGVLHARQSWVQDRFGNIRGEGMRYVLSELKSVRKFGLYWICSSLVSSAMKCAGYKLGRIERYLPVSLKRKIGMNHGFWR